MGFIYAGCHGHWALIASIYKCCHTFAIRALCNIVSSLPHLSIWTSLCCIWSCIVFIIFKIVLLHNVRMVTWINLDNMYLAINIQIFQICEQRVEINCSWWKYHTIPGLMTWKITSTKNQIFHLQKNIL